MSTSKHHLITCLWISLCHIISSLYSQRCHAQLVLCQDDLFYLFIYFFVIQCGSTGHYFGERESRALPCSPLCVAELTHSSPGPTLPQSSTASLRTLVYDSAVEQGSGGDSRQEKQLYTHTHTHVQTHMGHVTSVCHLSSVDPVSNLITVRPVTGVGVGSLSQSALTQEQEICFLPLVALIWSSHRC